MRNLFGIVSAVFVFGIYLSSLYLVRIALDLMLFEKQHDVLVELFLLFSGMTLWWFGFFMSKMRQALLQKEALYFVTQKVLPLLFLPIFVLFSLLRKD